MDKCVLCGKEMPPFTYREPHGDGFVCRKCSGKPAAAPDSKPAAAPAKAAKAEPEKKKESKTLEVPGLSEAIDNLLK